ncbi:MAG: GntR family transcriptional regulator [Cellvibrionales bacterium]|nr:MAG: GntR family transcriptional regulator [Cellvibrionales bacterium]
MPSKAAPTKIHFLTIRQNQLAATKRPTRLKDRQRFPFESLHLDSAGPTPLYRQLEEQLRQAIWQGTLKTNAPLPASRQLASLLNIARNTVIRAYEQLAVEGFIQARPGAGHRVAEVLPARAPSKVRARPDAPAKLEPRLSRRSATLTRVNNFIGPQRHTSEPLPFRAHLPDYKAFPANIWRQLYSRRLKHSSHFWQLAVHPCGYWPLRQAVADYLVTARGMTVVPEQVIITAGVQQSFELLAKIFIDSGDRVIFEDPAYTPAATVFAMAGATNHYVDVDREGLVVDALPTSGAKLLYTTPASHFPLGINQSQARRKALLAWASKTSSIILEDDYNGEHRYRGRPLTTLHGMATAGQVIYLGSFSKLLFPALRLGYMVVPETLIEPIAGARWLLDRHSPPLEQAVLTDFINDGHFLRHLRRMRALYAQRQAQCIASLERHLGEWLSVEPLDSGLHLIAELRAELKSEDFVAAAKSANVELSAVAQFASEGYAKSQSQLIFGYAAYGEAEMEAAAQRLAKQFAELPKQ